jgi:Immunity protein family (Imm11)
MRYFDLMDDIFIHDCWLLGTPTDQEGARIPGGFLSGEPIRVKGPLRVPLTIHGFPLDFSIAEVAPVVHIRIASILAEMAPTEVQLIPVEIDSHPDQYCLLNTLRLVKCVDDDRSEVYYWKPEDGEPERPGKYVSVFGLRIDPSKVGDARVFRPWGWEITLIVSEDIKDALERAGMTGARFKEVG